MSYPSNTPEFPNQPLNSDDCTSLTCPVDRSLFSYLPNLAYAVIPLVGFTIITIGHSFAGIKYRTWPFGIAMVIGALLEALGYLGRTLGNNDPFLDTAYMLQAIVLTFAPVFFCASIYMSLSRIVSVYGQHMSRIKPVWYTRIFITCDVISLLAQVAGGVVTSSASDLSGQNLGVNIMLGAIIFQVVTIAIFSGLAVEFAIRVKLNPSSVDMATDKLRATFRWKGFLGAMGSSTVLIFTRCVYRAVEMSQGWDGPLARNQETFLIFESIIVWLAGTVLLVFHPGFAYVFMRENQRIRDSAEPIAEVELEDARKPHGGNSSGGHSSSRSS